MFLKIREKSAEIVTKQCEKCNYEYTLRIKTVFSFFFSARKLKRLHS